MNDLITEYLKSRNLEKETVLQFSLRQILDDFDEFVKEKRLESLIKSITKKPKWLFSQWNFGWFTIYQSFERVEFGILFDYGYGKQQRPLFCLNILFWSVEIEF